MRAKRDLGEVLSAFEFLDRESLLITLRHLPGAKDPLPACQVRGRRCDKGHACAACASVGRCGRSRATGFVRHRHMLDRV